MHLLGVPETKRSFFVVSCYRRIWVNDVQVLVAFFVGQGRKFVEEKNIIWAGFLSEPGKGVSKTSMADLGIEIVALRACLVIIDCTCYQAGFSSDRTDEGVLIIPLC